MSGSTHVAAALPAFDRHFWDGVFRFTQIGNGELGGKAAGLVKMKELLNGGSGRSMFGPFSIDVPVMAVIATDAFDEFLALNHLSLEKFQDQPDDHIARAFQHADLPAELLGDLYALVEQVKTPLAVRSSSRLEDAMDRPFAGVYVTKMLPNNEPDPEHRFHQLTEAVKLVYGSTFFQEARDYIRAAGRDPRDEKMAVILQEVVGRRHGDRFYPDISGVARSYNFYPSPPAKAEDGFASLALGLGKTIVDGGIAWTFSPAFPKRPPPFHSLREMMFSTQKEFWAVNMGKPPVYDPVNEAECLLRYGIGTAELDGTLELIASSYDEQSEMLLPGRRPGCEPVLDFSPLLEAARLPISPLIQKLLRDAEATVGEKVEIEFAISVTETRDQPLRARFGFLQVRPMVVPEQTIDIADEDLTSERTAVASQRVIGNGVVNEISDVVYVRRDRFRTDYTPAIAREIEYCNRELMQQRRPYLLIGFGRWGSSHPNLGIPVAWSQISGARVIVESSLPTLDVELSQASHFFHNLASFRAMYFMVRHNDQPEIAWEWLERQPVINEGQFVRHVRLPRPLIVRADGRSARGVILAGESVREKS